MRSIGVSRPRGGVRACYHFDQGRNEFSANLLMIGVLIVAHDQLGDSLIKAATHVLGGRPQQFEAFSAKSTQLAAKFQSDVQLSRNGRKVNAKSIMGVMMLAAGKGSKIMLEVDGPDEEQAIDAICALIGDHFGEGE